MGKGRDWNVDLIPKFLMANGKKQTTTSHSKFTLQSSLLGICNLGQIHGTFWIALHQALGHTYPVA